jgi:hypothetical protein
MNKLLETLARLGFTEDQYHDDGAVYERTWYSEINGIWLGWLPLDRFPEGDHDFTIGDMGRFDGNLIWLSNCPSRTAVALERFCVML